MQLGIFLDVRKYWQIGIARRKFFDIQTAAKRSVVYLFLIATLAIVFFSVEFIIEKYIYNNDEVVDIVSAIVGAFVFSKLQNFFETLTDRIFFRRQYNYAEAIKNLNGILGKTIDLKELLGAITNFLAATIKPEKIVFFFNDSEDILVFENPAGGPEKPGLKKGYRAIAKQYRTLPARSFLVAMMVKTIAAAAIMMHGKPFKSLLKNLALPP